MFDNELFINEVSNEESIWNIENKLYHDKNAKHVSWTKVARASIADFDELEDIIKSKKIAELQKKWKSLRDSYRRKCITKSGQAATRSKPYIYANVLEFLRPTMQNRTTESNIQSSEDEKRSWPIPMQRPPNKKLKKNPKKTATSNFGSSLLKILENRQKIPEDPEKSFLLSLLPQIKSLDEDQKTRLYVEFLNAIQRVKNCSVTPTYPYNTPNNQPYSPFPPQHYYTTNNNPQSVSSSISHQTPLSHMPHFNITPHQYASQNVPTTMINNTTITSPQRVNDELNYVPQSPSTEIRSAQKQNHYYNY
ncbi:unnamed protein product [Macrosiphum euphorbiae]|uniref:MADF domain-containing protein n=1 Tax=Macrosiphum euphorbiae TaxID=13131 RepID=A0AAV0XYT5_9HEMI|nr:unnamed protein product [Macrosiphum euphorbiae]